MLKKIVGLIFWVLIVQFVGYLLGHITQLNIATWYHSLNKSVLNPPEIVFPIVWGGLYIMIAIAGWSLWRQRNDDGAKPALIFYGIQLLMNWAWTPIFFQLHLVQLAFYWIVGIAITTLITILIAWDKFKLVVVMLIPYWFWLLFAGYLNWVIWIKN
jgi:benzodiazapine receptor